MVNKEILSAPQESTQLSPSQSLDVAQTLILAARDAAAHIEQHLEEIHSIFAVHEIDTKFVVLAGFDERLILLGMGHRQHIFVHLFCDVLLPQSFLQELGLLLSPFPATIHKPTREVIDTPVYDLKGREMDLLDLAVKRTDRLADGFITHMASPSTHLASNSNPVAGGSGPGQSSGPMENGKGPGDDKGRKQDEDERENNGGGGGDGEAGPGSSQEPSACFISRADVIGTTSELQELQRLRIEGSITTKKNGPKFHRVRFLHLESQSDNHLSAPLPSDYQQYQLQITIDTKCGDSTTVIRSEPKSTPRFASTAKETSMKESGLSSQFQVGAKGLPFLPTLETFGNATATKRNVNTIEMVRNLEPILKLHDGGRINWRIPLNDANQMGVTYELPQDRLPWVDYQMLQNTPIPPAVFVEVGSYWKVGQSTQDEWWTAFLQSSRPTRFQNICHILLLRLPSQLETNVEYLTTISQRPTAQKTVEDHKTNTLPAVSLVIDTDKVKGALMDEQGLCERLCEEATEPLL
ncbi:hypothetical protein C8J56DRAFT_136292 [Mycena floridula]|nr:hypothetical protein C8J56DRAFT_136292 [Mycena floridula]